MHKGVVEDFEQKQESDQNIRSIGRHMRGVQNKGGNQEKELIVDIGGSVKRTKLIGFKHPVTGEEFLDDSEEGNSRGLARLVDVEEEQLF